MLMRKNEMFYRYLELYLEITLSVQLRKCIFSNNRWRSEVIEPNFNRLLSESPKISQLANIYYAVLFLSTEYRILIKWNRLEDVLVEGLLFGENLGREHFEEQKFYQIINKDLDDNLNKNHGTHINRNIYVRVHCIEFILNHLGGEQDLLNKLTNTLIQKSMHLGRSKPRYYANSQHHRIKLRIVQSLAFITNMTKEYNHLFWKTILTENNQLNITYLLELIVSQTIDRKNLIDLLKDQNNFKSPNTIQSLLVIAYLKCRKDDDKELCATIIEHMFQWTMSQHFMTRLYAQITMLKLIESFGSEKSSEHKIIYNSIVNSLLHGSNTAEQNIEKLKNDFRYNLIGPKNMLSISNIFYHIPRITEMADDEWKQFKCLKKESDLLNNCNQSWIKPNKNIVVNEMEIGSGIENIQKKILPIKESIPQTLPTINTRLLIAENDTSLDTDANLNGLIVVASLVSRFPNLGGLARSCEIFGVRKYVVDSLKHADNLEFQTLSMSAEKWLPIAEVKSFQLSDYLSYMKKNGYTIVGAEQTAKSCQITDVKFPKKTIVLLGHEKEGIPANLLSLLDIPVEIPQFGVVRSLNVHVTGAIFMWEYVKQHFIK